MQHVLLSGEPLGSTPRIIKHIAINLVVAVATAAAASRLGVEGGTVQTRSYPTQYVLF